MAASPSKMNGSSSSGNSFADLADSIIRAIETGFQNAGTQAQTGSAAGGAAGASAAAPVSDIIEPVGGIAGAGSSNSPNPAEHGGKTQAGPGGEDQHGSGEEGKPEHGEGKRGRVKDLGEYVDRIKEGFWEEEVGIGYPSLELATGISKRINELDKGQYVSPEERQASLAEAVLPGAGGIVGAAVGTAFGNPVLGSFVGQGIGEVGASLIGAKAERDETTREAAEKLAAALGLAEESVSSFRTQIEATGAPVAQVAQGLSVLESTGVIGNGAQAIAGAGQMALGLGEQYGPVMTTLSQAFSQNPGLFRVNDDFHQTGGALSGNEYRDVAQYELLQGDYPAYTAAQQAASATRYTANPQIQLIEKDKESKKNNWFYSGDNALNKALGIKNDPLDNIRKDDDQLDTLKEDDDKKRAEAAKGTKSEQEEDRKTSLARNQARFDTIIAQSDAQNLIERYRVDAFGNTSPQELAKRLPAIHAALEKNASADEVMIEQDQRQMAAVGPDSPLRPAYELEISQLKDDQVQKRDIRFREIIDANYKDQISTSTAVSSLAETRASIEGRSAEDIQAQVSRESKFLIGMVHAPGNPLNPQEAASIEESAIKQQYAAKLNAYTERLDENSLRTETAELGVTRTRLGGGSPDQVFSAQEGVLSTYTDRIKELNSEIERGGLTVADRTAKERELASAQSVALTLSVEAVRQRDSSASSIASSNLERDETGLDRVIERSGNAGSGSAAYADSYTRIAAIDRQYADEKDPAKKAALGAEAQKVREDAEQLLDRTNTYNPGSAITRQAASDRTNFQIAMLAPYLSGGPDSDTMTRGQAVLSDLNRDLSGLDKNRAALLKSGQWRDEDETRYTQQKNSDRLEIAQIEHDRLYDMFGALPESIVGSPGSGIAAGIIPTAAMAARFTPSPLFGSWGRSAPDPAQPASSGTGLYPMPGGAAGGFNAVMGVSNTEAILQRILLELQRGNREGGGGGATSPMNLTGAIGGVLGRTYNPARQPR